MVSVLGVLLLGALIWTGAITRTSSNVQQFLNDLSFPRPPSLSLILVGHSETSASVSYIQSVTHPPQAAPGARYPASTFSTPTTTTQPQAVPKQLPVPLTNVVYKLGSAIRDLVKVLIFLGVLSLVVARRRIGLSLEHLSLIVGALAVLVAALVIPTVSVQYDPGRVYQQTLILLTLPFVGGAAVLSGVLRIRRGQFLVGAVAFAAYLAVTPLIPELLGSGYASMQLNNYGPYYAVYYVHTPEVQAIHWLDRYGVRTVPIYADWFAARKIAAFSERPIWVVPNVVPSNLVPTSYVFGDVTNTQTGTAYGDYHGAMVTYPFPTRLSDVKDVLFSAGDVSISR